MEELSCILDRLNATEAQKNTKNSGGLQGGSTTNIHNPKSQQFPTTRQMAQRALRTRARVLVRQPSLLYSQIPGLARWRGAVWHSGRETQMSGCSLWPRRLPSSKRKQEKSHLRVTSLKGCCCCVLFCYYCCRTCYVTIFSQPTIHS